MLLGALFDPNGGRCLVPRVWKAASTWERMRGLLGRPPLGGDEGLLLDPCRSVHTIGMRYPLDLVFIDSRGLVCKTVPSLGPGRMTGSLAASTTLELAAGTLTRIGLARGDRVEWHPDATSLRGGA
jgi:uncharacterized membrane protein (UPF0127 family)